MGTVFKIAFRNLKEHKIKTLIIGTLIMLGIAILVIGNSLMDTATQGIKKNYIENFTGHVMIAASTETAPNILGMNEETMEDGLKKIPDYDKLIAYIDQHPAVETHFAQVSGMATMSVNGEGLGFSMIFGVDPDEYQTMFPANITITEGFMLESKQEGILLSNLGRMMLESSLDTTLKPGDNILLNVSTANAGIKIREVPIRGFFEYNVENMMLQMISLVDIQTVRSLQGMTLFGDLEAELTSEEEELLGSFDEEALFSDFSFDIVETAEGVKDDNDLFTILGDTSNRDLYNSVDSEAYHFLLVRLENDSQISSFIRDIRQFTEQEDIDVKVYDWIKAAGQTAEVAYNIKFVFNVVILIIAIVALIIIMNTLVIFVSERVPEIGTMRAIGAQKGFVRWIIMLETVILSLGAGIIGILLGSGVIGILKLTGIESSNMFLQILFGGDVLYPVLSVNAIGTALLDVLIIGVVASLYPVSMALKIQPVKAMQS